MKPKKPLRAAAAVLLAALCVTTGCKHVAAGTRTTEESAVPTTATHPAYAGRAMLLLPAGAHLRITTAEVNEVTLETTPNAAGDFQKKWDERVALIRSGGAAPANLSKLEREWPADHTVQYDTARGSIDVRIWERWGVLGTNIVQGTTATSLAQAEAARGALRDIFRDMLPDGTPTAGDFRFEGGLVRAPLNGAEHISAEWKEPLFERPGEVKGTLDFKLFTDVLDTIYGKPDTLERLAKARVGAAQDHLNFKELRATKRTVDGLDGEESAYILADPKFPLRVGFSAEWTSMGRSHDAFAPSVEMSVGVENMNPADAEAALAQWTAALQSLRFPRR